MLSIKSCNWCNIILNNIQYEVKLFSISKWLECYVHIYKRYVKWATVIFSLYTINFVTSLYANLQTESITYYFYFCNLFYYFHSRRILCSSSKRIDRMALCITCTWRKCATTRLTMYVTIRRSTPRKENPSSIWVMWQVAREQKQTTGIENNFVNISDETLNFWGGVRQLLM